MNNSKACTKCGQNKPSNTIYFYADKGQSSGLKPECKQCTLALKKKYYSENAEKLRERSKAYRETDPERWKSVKRRFRKNHPEAIQNDRRKRTARKKEVPHSPYTSAQVIEMYGTNCHLCGEPIDMNAPRWTAMPGYEQGLHLDHVIRISEGGPDTIENIRPAHGICNQIKG